MQAKKYSQCSPAVVTKSKQLRKLVPHKDRPNAQRKKSAKSVCYRSQVFALQTVFDNTNCCMPHISRDNVSMECVLNKVRVDHTCH